MSTETTIDHPAALVASRPGLPVFDHFGWDDDDRLICTDAATLNSVRRKALSPSTSNSLGRKSCPARWAVDKVLRMDDPMTAAGKGTGAHSILELFFQLPGPERTKTKITELGGTVTAEQWGDDADGNLARLWRRDVQGMAVGIFSICDPTKVDVIQTEMKIDGVEIDGVPFNGTIDLVERLDDGSIRLIDFKSGKVQNSFFGDFHGDQLRLYVAAWEALRDVTVAEAKVYYISHGKTHTVNLSDTAMRKTLRAYRRAWARHNDITSTGLFPTKVTSLCGWCPVVDQCPTAKQNGKVARVALPDPVLVSTARRVQSVGAARLNGHNVEHRASPQEVDTEGDTMSTTDENASAILSPSDGKNWVTENNGKLHPASYAYNKLVELVTFANFSLQDYRQPNTSANRLRYARLLQWMAVEIVDEAHPDYTDDDYGSGMMKHATTTMRYVIRQMGKRTTPVHPPFGQDAEAWEKWSDKVIARSADLLCVAAQMYQQGTASDVADALDLDDDDVFGESIDPWLDQIEGDHQ